MLPISRETGFLSPLLYKDWYSSEPVFVLPAWVANVSSETSKPFIPLQIINHTFNCIQNKRKPSLYAAIFLKIVTVLTDPRSAAVPSFTTSFGLGDLEGLGTPWYLWCWCAKGCATWARSFHSPPKCLINARRTQLPSYGHSASLGSHTKNELQVTA